MKKTILIAALLLVSSAALAEDTAPVPTSPTATVSVAALKGQTVTFVDAAGTVIATLNPDGTLNATGDLKTVTQVVVTDAAGKSTTYALSGDLSKSGQVKVTVDGKVLPLVAVLNSNSNHDKVKTGKDDGDDSSDDADDTDDDKGQNADHHGNGNSDTTNGNSGEHHGNGNSDTKNGKSGEDHGNSGDKGNSGKGK